MHKNFPSKLPELIVRHHRCMRLCLLFSNASHSLDPQLQTVDLLTVESRSEREKIARTTDVLHKPKEDQPRIYSTFSWSLSSPFSLSGSENVKYGFL
uniref:Uncharacterized protein n=1 Tax=Lepeophtheirus salmonis TaxID=72036 RepID=A0A0K2UCN6_LEPSM